MVVAAAVRRVRRHSSGGLADRGSHELCVEILGWVSRQSSIKVADPAGLQATVCHCFILLPTAYDGRSHGGHLVTMR